MMFAGFLFLLLLTGGSSVNNTKSLGNGRVMNQNIKKKPLSGRYTEEGDLPANCTYPEMIKHLNLTDKVEFYMARPSKNNMRPTNVKLYLYLYSILDVKEKEQELVAYFWINMIWKNEFIKWKPEDFCRIKAITVPSELLWKPDITIEEMTQKDKLFQTQYLFVGHDEVISLMNGIVLVSTCKMRFYRFPFDTQTCNLTFKSVRHGTKEIKLISGRTREDIFNRTRIWMQTESEWLLMNITVETEKVYKFSLHRSVLVYSMTMKRRSVLYVANFVVPILFFLCLDLASFLISESGGEKLSFKVTVLLAVTVMQLILNDILPSSSDRIPLIAVYCIGVFTLMMLSLLETILMMYLMEKDDVSQEKEADKDQSLGDNCVDQQGKVQNCFRDINKSIPCVRVFDESPGETPPELLPEVKEIQSPKDKLDYQQVLRQSIRGNSSQLTEEIHDSENLMDELREVLEAVALLLSSRKEENGPGYWTRMTKKLNRIYFIFYIIAACVFLGYVFSIWLRDNTK